MVWLDGLDIPIVRLLDASFAEPGEAEMQAVARGPRATTPRASPTICCRSTGSPRSRPRRCSTTPMPARANRSTCWPATTTPTHATATNCATSTRRTAISRCRRSAPSSSCCRKGFATRPYRSTDGTVFVAVEGAGESRVGDQILRWQPRDMFVVPSWATVSHQASDEAVLFSYSDRPVQEKLGLFREQRGNA